MKRLIQAAGLALGIALLAASSPQAAGNGGFTVYWGGNEWDPDVELYILLMNCNTGYTCGTVNLEVDWDDGSAIDSHVEHWSTVSEEEFDHEYDSDGTYTAEFSADDHYGNWWKVTRKFIITGA